MTDIQKEIMQLRQTKLDLIESGIIRAAGALINESADAANDGRLTLANVTLLVHRLDEILAAYSDAKNDVDSFKDYVATQAADKQSA